MQRISAFGCVLTLAALLLGCGYSLPLGGIAPGRGRPIGERGMEIGMSFGNLPELGGTLPPVGAPGGDLVNPVPTGSDRRTGTRGTDLIGVTLGFTDDLDVGLNFSRGLFAVWRTVHREPWSLSFSPAVFWYNGRSILGFSDEQAAHVRNLNLTGLLDVTVASKAPLAADLYIGTGISRFRGRIRVDEDARSRGVGTVPTVLMGLNLEHSSPINPEEWEKKTTVGLGLEIVGAWIQQRTGQRDFVPVVRIQGRIAFGVPKVRRRRMRE